MVDVIVVVSADHGNIEPLQMLRFGHLFCMFNIYFSPYVDVSYCYYASWGLSLSLNDSFATYLALYD